MTGGYFLHFQAYGSKLFPCHLRSRQDQAFVSAIHAKQESPPVPSGVFPPKSPIPTREAGPPYCQWVLRIEGEEREDGESSLSQSFSPKEGSSLIQTQKKVPKRR